MKALVRILIIDDNQHVLKRLKGLINHPQVVIDSATKVPEDAFYNFYVLGGSIQITEAVDKIREFHEGSPIYLSGPVCEKNVPVRKMIGCNIVDCLENEKAMREFVRKITSFCKQKAKMREASSKLDCLKAGDLKALAK